MKNIKNPLYHFDCLNSVNKDILDYLFEQGTVQQYKKGKILLQPKNEKQPVLFLLDGITFRYNLTSSGKRKVLFIFKEGTVLNETVLIDNDEGTFTEAKTAVKVLAVSKSDVRECMKKDLSFVEAMMRIQDRRVWRLTHQLKNTTGGITVERKLASKLWKLSKDFGVKNGDITDIAVDLSITFLADMLGVPRETASRACKNLVEQKMIVINKKKISVYSEKLKEFFHS